MLPEAAGGFGVLTAAAADQVAVWDDEAKHGVFTKHLLDALYGAADAANFGNSDGQVTLVEAKAYLDINMTRAARRIGREQNPSVDGNNPEMVLVALPGKLPPPPSLVQPGGPTGKVMWDRIFGGGGNDLVYSAAAAGGGGFLIGGSTESKGAGGRDAWVLRLDGAGRILWDRTFGDPNNDGLWSVVQLSNGGIVGAGWTTSQGAGSSDLWGLLLDGAGNVTWERTFGGSGLG